MTTPSQRLLALAKRQGVIRPEDLRAQAIAPVYLTRLVRSGMLVRVGRGLYSLAVGKPTADRTIVEAARHVPRGVVCLLSALRLHGLTTQMPPGVWMAIDGKARQPGASGPPLEVVRMSGRALSEGVEERVIEGVRVDVAAEALRDYRRQRGSVDELVRYAEVCRVARVLRPFLEALS
jgi:predicted transcriptional regulator of viral defense system